MSCLHNFVIVPKEVREKGQRPRVRLFYRCTRCGYMKARDGVTNLVSDPTKPKKED